MSQIRSNEVYIGRTTHTALRLVSNAKGCDEHGNKMTVDGLADTVLKGWLAENHKDVLAFIERTGKEWADFEKEQAAKLGLWKDPLAKPISSNT